MGKKSGFIVGGPKHVDGQWYASMDGDRLRIPALNMAAHIDFENLSTSVTDLITEEVLRYTFVIVDGKEIGFWVPEETSVTELFKRLIASYSKLAAAEKGA
jgi:hypothetical protein